MTPDSARRRLRVAAPPDGPRIFAIEYLALPSASSCSPVGRGGTSLFLTRDGI